MTNLYCSIFHRVFYVLLLAMPLSMSAQNLPVPGVEGDLTICAGTTTTITATSSDSTATFRWYDALVGGNLLSSQAAFSTPLLSASASYFVEQNASGQTSARRRVEVLVTSLPQNTIPQNVVASPSWICQDSSSRLFAEVDEAAGQWVYWYDAPVDGNLLSQNRSGTPYEVAPQQTTTYYAQSVTKVDTATFPFTGAPQMWIVPDGVTEVEVDAYGARGGHSHCCSVPSAIIDAGKGGRVEGILKVNPGDTLWMYVGGAGTNSPNNFTTDPLYAGGWNGGGNGGYSGAGGGGATDIRLGGTSLEDRILVAGGGGGATKINSPHNYDDYRGGPGGGLTGGSSPDDYFGYATGGSQISGGSGNGYSPYFGQDGSFGQGGNRVTPYSGAGGGGGWYGGAGSFNVGGGGGSSYTDTSLVYGVNHEQGVWNDHGKLVLYYYTNADCQQDSTRVPVTVTVYETPHIEAGPNLITCLGTPVDLSVTGADTYLWTPGDLTGDTVTVNPTETTTFTVTGQKLNPEGVCPSVPDQITVSVTEVSAGSDKVICRGQTVTLSASGADNYHWLTTGETTITIMVSPEETTSYVVEGINESGCSTYDTVIVEVSDIPVTNAGADVTIFAGDSLTLQASGADTYQWSPGGIVTSQYRVGPAATQTFSVTGTLTSTGCTTSDQVLVTILPLPDVTGQTTLLQGDSTTLKVQSPAGETFYWYDADQTTLLGTGDSITTGALQDNTTLYVGYEHPDAPDKLKPIHLTVVTPPAEILVASGGDCPDAITQLYVEPSLGTTAWYGDAGFTEFLGYGDTLSVQSFESKTYFVRKEIQPDTIVFDYTGTPQMWVVPPGLFSLEADAYGARGGFSHCCSVPSAIIDAGRGGRASGKLSVQPGDTLWMYVGGAGTNSPNNFTTDPLYAGGWNGGGNGGYSGAGGGGATDIRLGGTSLEDRILVAGGGGGATKINSPHNYDDYRGGPGGGLTGGSSPDNYFGQATGGSQISGGSGNGYSPYFGQDGSFGQGGNRVTPYSGAGGGGGWYGGAGSFNVGAGGGSSYSDPALVHDVAHQQGVHNAAGQLILRYGTTGYTQAISTTISGNTDTVAPVARARDTIIYLNEFLTATVEAAELDAGSSDNCSIASLVVEPSVFTCADIGDQVVTFTATDASGNTDQTTVTIHVVDSVPPVAVGRDTFLYLDENGQAELTPAEMDNGSTDNCFIVIIPGAGGLSFELTQNTFGPADFGMQSIGFIAIDTYGNRDTTLIQVDVRDAIPPEAICQTANAYLDVDGVANIAANSINGGSTDQVGIAELAIALDPGLAGTPVFGESLNLDCADRDNAIPVLLQVTDLGGNTHTCQTTVTVLDTLAPVVACRNETIYIGNNQVVDWQPTDLDNGSYDNCGFLDLSIDKNHVNCSGIGEHLVTLTAADHSGNSASCTSMVTVLDTISPTVHCADVTVYLEASGLVSIWASDPAVFSYDDNCDNPLVALLDKSTFTCADVGPNTVTLTVMDQPGNRSSCTSTVTVLDTITPEVECRDVQVYLDENGQGELNASQVLVQTVSNCALDTTYLDRTIFSCGDIGTHPVLLTAMDQSGNTSSCQTTVTVLDTLAPVVLCRNETIYIRNNQVVDWQPTDLDNGSYDNCGFLDLSIDKNHVNCSGIGEHLVTLTAADHSGNSASCTSMVTVLDTISPTVHCADVTVYLEASGLVSIWASDPAVFSYDDNCDNPLVALLDKSTFTCADAGPNTVTLTVIDQSENRSSCTSTVTVLDTLAPVVSCKDATIYVGGDYLLDWQPTAIDNGSYDNCGSLELSLDKYSVPCFETGEHLVTLTATDDSGNSASCTSTVTALDTTAPTVTCSDLTLYLDATGEAVLGDPFLYDFRYDDNCSYPDTTMFDRTYFGCGDIGQTTITFTGVDQAGNSASCTSTVTVVDTITPEVECRDVEVYLDENGQGELGTAQVLVQTMDNCTLDTTYLDRSLFSCGDMGSHTVTLTTEFTSGNTANCTSTVTVLDTLAPVVSCKDTTIYVGGDYLLDWLPKAVNNGSYDNCGSLDLTLDIYSVPCSETGEHLVTLTATDDSGNSASCTSTVTALDTTAPTVTCSDLTLYLDATGEAVLGDPFLYDFRYDDNCSYPDTTMFDRTHFSCADVGQNTITFTGVDQAGNTASCTSTISVVDTIPPTEQCADITVYLDPNGQFELSTVHLTEFPQDACGVDTMFLDKTLFTCADVGQQSITITARDVNGNETSCTSTVTVLDTIAPLNLWEEQTIYLDATGTRELSTAQIDPLPQDACGIDTIFFDRYLFTCADVGEQDLMITAIDVHGNEVSYTRPITVLDTISPALACRDFTGYLDESGLFELSLDDILISADDACGIEEVSLNGITQFGCAMPPVNVDIEALDVNGNASYCRSQVTIIDTIPPAQVCRDTTVYLDENGIYDLSLEDVLGDVHDACGIDTIGMNTPMESLACASPPVQVEVWATDHSGNTTHCVSTVTVLDTLAPQVVCRDAIAYLDRNGGVTITPDLIDNGSTDACSISMLELDQTNFSCSDVGEQIVTLTATDPSGNATSCTATVTVSDTIAPEVTAKTFLYLDLEPETANLQPDEIVETVFEACGQDSVWLNRSFFTEQDTGLHWVEWYVRDFSGNITTDSVQVHVVAPMVLTTQLTHESCHESNDGSIDLRVQAGVPPYRYAWSNGTETADLTNLEAGTYTVTVTDARDHTAMETVELTQPQPLIVNQLTQDASCFSESDGLILTSVEGGTGPYTYLWNTGAETSALANIPAGTYALTVTDANQCQVFADTSISEPADFNVEPVADIGPVCTGDAVRVLFASDAPEATFTWTNTNPAIGLPVSGAGAIDFSALNETMFAQTGTIVVTPHYDGCTGNSDTFEITVACPAVAGQVRWYRTGAGMAGVAVEQMGDAAQETQTNADGEYALPAQPGWHFRHHPSFPELTLTGEELPDYGIDENDIQRLQDHLGGGTPLHGYELLAGDINDNGQLSSADLVLMQYALQGFEEPLQFFEREAWKFVDASIQVVDSLIFEYSDTLRVNERHGQVPNISWLGVRKGDLTGSNGSLDYDPVISTSPSPPNPVDARTDAPGLSLAIISDQGTATCGDVFEAVVIAQNISEGDTISLLTLDAGVHWATDELLLLEAVAGHFRGGETNVFTAATKGQVSLTWKDLTDGGVPVVEGDTVLTLTYEVRKTPGPSTLRLAATPGTQPAGALSYLVGFQYSENWESMPAQVEFVPETIDFELSRVSPYKVETVDISPSVCKDDSTVPLQVSFQQMAEEAPTHYSINFFAEAENMGLMDVAHATLPANGLIDLQLPTDLPEGTIAFELSVGDGANCYSEPKSASVEVVAAPEVVLNGLPEIICPGTMVNVEAFLDDPESYSYSWQMCDENGTDCRTLGSDDTNVTFDASEAGTYELLLTVSGEICDEVVVRSPYTVQELPVITYPLPDDEIVYCQGTSVYLAFTADQPGTTFQWFNTNTDIGLPASGTGPLSFNAASAGTTTITVTPVTNGCEGDPVTFSLEVQSGAPNNVSLGLNQDTFCLTDEAFLVTAMPEGGILNGPGTNTTPGFFAPEEAGPGSHILAYSYGNDGCITTATDTVVVLPNPAVDLPGDTTVCAASQATLSVTGTPSAIIWYRENGTDKRLMLDGSGHGTLNWPGLAENIQIDWDSIGFAGSGHCVELLIESTTIEVAPEISGPAAEVMGTACPGGSLVVNLSGEAGLQVVYQLMGEEPDSLILPTDGDTVLVLMGLLETSNLELLRVRRSDMSTCTLDLSGDSIELPVREAPQLANAPNTFLCSGETFELDLTSLVLNEVPVTFAWEVVSETSTTGAMAGSGDQIQQVLENKTGETISFLYRVTVTPNEGDCSGSTLLVPVQVFSEPVAALSVQDQTLCPADTLQPIQITVTNNMTTQTNLNWERDGLTEVSGVPNGTGQQISGLLTNLTQTDQMVTYSVYLEATNGCTGDTLTSIVRLPVDETAPEAVCPPVVRVAVNRVSGVRMYGHELDAGSSDNCGIYEYGLSMDSVGWNERGTHEVTLTVRDISGNSDDCTFRLEVTEEQACRAQLNVVLDENGQYELTPQQVITGAMAPGLRIQVDDSQPGNGAIVDCPGEYRYAIFDESDALVCWGYVLGEDKSAPTVVSLSGKKDSLICTYVDQLAHNPATVDPADRYYLGHVTFTDNTSDCADCTLPEATFTDRVEYLDCPADLAFGAEYVYARMYRTFVQKDCYGNERDTTIIYNLIKPTISDFRLPTSDLEFVSCNPDTVTIPDSLGLPYLISAFGDTLTLADIDCQYAWSVEDQTFPTCEGRGLKVERIIRVMDWCAKESGTPFDTVLIKIGDFENPELHGPMTDLRMSPYSDPVDFLAWYDTAYLQQEIVPGLNTWQELVDYAREQGTLSTISTGPADCTGALLLEQDWIEQQFGVSVSDNCELREVGYELLQYGPENKGQEITGNYHWRSTNYQLQGNTITGLPAGIYALAITGRDYCGLSSTGLVLFTVEDQIAPVMTCDDQVTVTLNSEGLARIVPADLEEGSWDNCGSVSLALRQKDMDTLWQQEVWLDCSLVNGTVVVEVQGTDAAGNTNTCWTEVIVEDKVEPLCADLAPITLACDDPGLQDLGSFGLPETPFSNCGNIDILELEAITDLDQCGFGTITRQFVAVKDQGTESEQRSDLCEQVIEVVAHHDYWLAFPADQTAACGEDVTIRGVAFAEEACDLIAISHTDERFYATQDPEACYKIFRTYRVINWCEYDGEAQPTIVSRDWDGWNGENPRHPDGDDLPGDEDMYVIVKRNLADGHRDTVFYDNNPNPHDGSIQQDGITYDHWWAVLSGNNDPDTEDYYEGIPGHVPGCTDCHSTWSYDGDQTDSDIAGNVQGDDADFRYGSFGYWQYTQHILVYDDVAPALTITGVDTFCSISNEDCSGPVQLTITATDLCTDDRGDVTVSVGLDMYNNGNLDQDVTDHFDPSTGLFSGRYPIGEHRLVVTGNDGCGNQAMGDYVFSVVDCKAPAPIVIDALSVELMPSDSDSTGAAAVVWASDFVASPVYDCNGQDGTQTDANGNPLVTQYSVNRVGEMPDPAQDHLYVICTEAVRTLEVEIHAWDEAGNHDFATTYLLVQDNMGLCEEPIDGAGGISGGIATEHDLPVPNVEVRLSGSSHQSYLTDKLGGYSLFGLEEGVDYTVTPGLNDDPLNGVSTFDLVLISKHILGLQPLESPYQQIAADINRSGRVTTLDLIQLRKLILHIDAEFSNNTSWRFVDADYGFRQNSNPLDQAFPEVKNINNLEGEEIAEFVAIKVGDVNGNANVAELRSFARSFPLNVAEQELRAGNEYRIPVTTDQLAQIEGYQFTLEIDPSVAEIIDVESGITTDEHFGVFVDKGIITSSFNQPNSTFNIEHSTLFTLVLRPTVDTKVSEVLRITSRYTAAEAYSVNGDLLNVRLSVEDGASSAGNELYQNIPNPFRSETKIGFFLAKAGQATLTIRDMHGRTVYTASGIYGAGYQQVRIREQDLSGPGVYTYTLETKAESTTRKMVLGIR